MITLPSRLRMGVPAVALGGPATYVGGITATGVEEIVSTNISGTQSGDVYISAFSDDSNITSFGAMTAPSGWAGMNPNWPLENTNSSIDYVVGYGTTAGTVATTSRTVDVCAMVAFRNLGTPPSTHTTSVTGISSSTILPSMTVTEAGSTALIIAFIDDDDTDIKTVPSGYTLAVENGRSGGSMAIMYQLDMPVGATGTAEVEWSNTDALLNLGYIIPPPS